MVDLDVLIEKTYRFKLEGKLINVNQPSVNMVKKFGSFEKLMYTEEILDKQVELITDILNNNTSGVKFSEEQIANYPQPVLNAIINTVTNGIEEADNHPNLSSLSQMEQ